MKCLKLISTFIIALIISTSFSGVYLYAEDLNDPEDYKNITVSPGYLTDENHIPIPENGSVNLDNNYKVNTNDMPVIYEPIFYHSNKSYGTEVKIRGQIAPYWDGLNKFIVSSEKNENGSISCYFGENKELIATWDNNSFSDPGPDKIVMLPLTDTDVRFFTNTGETRIYKKLYGKWNLINKTDSPPNESKFADIDYDSINHNYYIINDNEINKFKVEIQMTVDKNYELTMSYVNHSSVNGSNRVTCAPQKINNVAHFRVYTNPILVAAGVRHPSFPDQKIKGNNEVLVKQGKTLSFTTLESDSVGEYNKMSMEASVNEIGGYIEEETSIVSTEIKGNTESQSETTGGGVSYEDNDLSRWYADIFTIPIDTDFVNSKPINPTEEEDKNNAFRAFKVVKNSATESMLPELEYMRIRELNNNTSFMPDLNNIYWGNININDPNTYNKPTNNDLKESYPGANAISTWSISKSNGSIDGSAHTQSAKVGAGVSIGEKVSIPGFDEKISMKFGIGISNSYTFDERTSITRSITHDVKVTIGGTRQSDNKRYKFTINRLLLNVNGNEVPISDIGVDDVKLPSNNSNSFLNTDFRTLS
jgi:hypothetical protein